VDIETLNKGRVPDTSTASEGVICITCYDNLTDVYTTFVWRSDIAPGQTNDVIDDSLHEINYYKNEQDMLIAFIKFVYDTGPDIMTGWFSNSFDIPYLINRMIGIGLEPSGMSPLRQVYIRNDGEPIIRGTALIDLIDVYKRFTFNVEESYSLDYIAKKTVNKGKIGTSNNINWMWRYNLDELIKYNSNDTRLCVLINQQRQLLDFLNEIRSMCFCQFEDVLVTSRMVDQYILRMFHGKFVFSTKTHHESYEYEGAIVESWAKGTYNNVVCFDMISLYPSLIRTFNLSPDTIIADEDKKRLNSLCINGTYFRKDKKGFLVEVIDKLSKDRIRYKDLMKDEKVGTEKYNLYYGRQYALKTLLNSVYGQMAYSNSRIYSPKIAETITFLGRSIIKWSKKRVGDLGFQVLYCDTDSLYFTGNRELTIDEIEIVRKKLNESFDEFISQVIS